jgi:hypothetical protein
MSRSQSSITAALGLLLLASSALAEPPTQARVPILVVDAGRQVSLDLADAVAVGLGAPVIRGAGLARALRDPETEPPTYNRAALAGDLAAAEDLFFAGKHAAARDKLEHIVSTVEGDPCALALDSDQRRVAFKARLYLASIERGDDNDAAVAEMLARTAARYPELSPELAEFPPWLREAYQAAAASAEPADAPRCEISTPAEQLVVGVEPDDVRITVGQGTSTDDLAPDLFAVCRSGGWPRMVAVIGRPDAIEIALIDADGTVARSEQVKGGEAEDLTDAADRLVSVVTGREQDLAEGDLPQALPTEARAAWYSDGLAWVVTGAGLAIAGTGFALGRAYGSPSSQEPAAWAMMVSGAAVAGTGVVLFIVPDRAGNGEGTPPGTVVGISGSFTF